MFIIKGLFVALSLSLYFLLALTLYPLYLINKDRIRPVLSNLIQVIAIVILKILNVTIESNVEKNSTTGTTIICNHQSYLDILIILARFKTSFLTSVEIRETLFLGQICELAGCFFTERRHKKNLRKEVEDFKSYLVKNRNITFFPEGTSTDASEIKSFKKPFFYPSTELKQNISVLTLNYKKLNSTPLNKSNRDLVCWYGDMEFFDHFINLLKVKKIEVNLQHTIHKSCGEIENTVDTCRNIIRSNFKTV